MRAHATEEWAIFMALPALTIKQRVAENAANSFHPLSDSNGINCCDDTCRRQSISTLTYRTLCRLVRADWQKSPDDMESRETDFITEDPHQSIC